MATLSGSRKKVAVGDLILSFEIGSEWAMTDFDRVFFAVDQLYFIEYTIQTQLEEPDYKLNLSDYLALVDIRNYSKRSSSYNITNLDLFQDRWLREVSIASTREYSAAILLGTIRERVYVRRIQYASDGMYDLGGAGKVMEVLANTVTKYVPNKHDKLQNEMLAQEIEGAKLDNMKKRQEIVKGKIELLEKLGYSQEEIRQIILVEEAQLKTLQEYSTPRTAVDGTLIPEKIKSVEIKQEDDNAQEVF